MSVCVGLLSAHSAPMPAPTAMAMQYTVMTAADAEEHDHAAGLGAPGELVEQDERDEHHGQAKPLVQRVRTVYVE